jgi:hypothetical protein
MEIDVRAFEYAISKINDGFVFEEFSKCFLSGVHGYSFIPVGGSKDKGIDAYQHLFQNDKHIKTIFQISTEMSWEEKIKKTYDKLIENKLNFDRIIYVTNRKLNNTEIISDKYYEEYHLSLIVYDIRWFVSNCNLNEKTINAFNIFSGKYLHEFNQPGKSSIIANLDNDSRVYVFLRQQFDRERNEYIVEDLLVDTLILYSLEGTDPDKNILLSLEQIRNGIQKYIKFDLQLLDSKIKERLGILCKKPRKVKYHTKFKGYCLPYETRCEIVERNLGDERLHDEFLSDTKTIVKKYIKDEDVSVRDINGLICTVLNTIYYQQGLEFSNFVINGDNNAIFEQNLYDVISKAVDNSAVVFSNKEKVKSVMALTIREIVYQGSENQLKYLKSLSNTYLMMYLLHWEPKISIYFNTLASKLKVFVDNSIIIPALSEIYLDDKNKRHWNLLIGAKKAGISLFINETLLHELITHFRMIKIVYRENYEGNEGLYLNNDIELFYIDEILIRAYFYSKQHGKTDTFDGFIDNFVDPAFLSLKDDIIEYLKETFGIIYISNVAWDIKINEEDREKIFEQLSSQKSTDTKARNDAEMILAIYYLRERDKEITESGIFGYRTWWLSKDVVTYKAVTRAFHGEKYTTSCFIRPDFIYNYIALLPSVDEVNNAYNNIFPSMLGVNLSYHMPKEVVETIHQKLKEFHDRPIVRIKQTIKTLTDKLKTDPSLRYRQYVESFFDKEFKKDIFSKDNS